jgi:hypothetical protein
LVEIREKGRCVMSEKLKRLIEKARHHQMSPEEEREQELRFAFGNAHYENDQITPELVAEVRRALDGDETTKEAA